MKFKTALFSFIILLIINALVFINRDKFLYTKQVSYNELYPKVSTLFVKNISAVNDSVLCFEMLAPKAPKTWKVGVDGKEARCNTEDPLILLTPGLHYYSISADQYSDSITASVEYIPAIQYRKAFVGIYKTNAVDMPENENEISTAKIPITPQQQLNVTSLLKDSLRINLSMPADEKSARIGKWLYKKIFHSRGQPSAEVLQMNPYNAYNAAVSGKKIWCGIYAMIFDMFASQAGLKCRLVEIRQDVKNFTGPVHEFNEYFSPEKRQWIAVDMMFNNMGYRNAANELLNGADVKNIPRNDSSVQVLKAEADSSILQPFNRSESFFFDLYGREKELYFYRFTANDYNRSVTDRLKNYISRRYWYEFYSDTRIADNRNFYFKQVLLVLLLISVIFTGSFMLRNRYKKNDRI